MESRTKEPANHPLAAISVKCEPSSVIELTQQEIDHFRDPVAQLAARLLIASGKAVLVNEEVKTSD